MSNDNIVTRSILITSLSKHYDISHSDAENIAELILDIFGFESRILDNILSHKVRRIFYLLQEESIVVSQHEQGTMMNGQIWELYYWFLNNDIIFHYANSKKMRKIFPIMPHKKPKKFSIYDILPDSVWTSRKSYLNSI